ncbi:MAG: diguanylate cyclase [Planctomycetes bacterium]|nr:diguanylate cyclase [Planctomycetota bacterium]
MKGISTTTRLSFGLASVTMTILFLVQQFGVIPDPYRPVLEGRAELFESLAVQFSLAAQKDQFEIIQKTAYLNVERNPDIQSISVKLVDGAKLVETEGHASIWSAIPQDQSVATHLEIPLHKGEEIWAHVQICFEPMVFSGVWGLWSQPIVRLALILAISGFPIYWLYLHRALRHIDPSKVIPGRVKAILDTLSEGVLVLDEKEQIVLANEAFIERTGVSAKELQGRKASEIDWVYSEQADEDMMYPWEQSVRQGENQKSFPLTFQVGEDDVRTFMVNSSPIRGTDGKTRGALATFDDVSDIEEKNTKLEKTLSMLKESRGKIKQQNDELKQLSMQDPLTSCLNRRAFFERFDSEWSGTSRYDYPVSCIMIDLDHFKLINDDHGHSVGDQVLQGLSSVLKTATRKTDSVCRYGGEEFCVLLPHTDINQAVIAAENIRRSIEALYPSNIAITASLGISTSELGAGNPQELIEQADQALYAAKHGGRNMVVRWDQMPDEEELSAMVVKTPEDNEDDPGTHIPFSAVSALVSALEHRDVATAVHSRRVADLCVAMSKGLMSAGDCFILEVAALLHDIGKLGVPDAILLKPGPLTKEEWQIMETHDRMGVEIIQASFGAPELTNIVKYCHAWFGGSPVEPELPVGENIPLRSRIVLISDAYDAMTSDRVYRKALSQQEAFEELRRCAHRQFDPMLVERLIETVLARDENRRVTPLPASRAKALRIGLEIERIACALEFQDLSLIGAIVENLVANANKLGLNEIAESADNLKQSTTKEHDYLYLIEQTNDLLELCRSHQQSCLSDSDSLTNDSTEKSYLNQDAIKS